MEKDTPKHNESKKIPDATPFIIITFFVLLLIALPLGYMLYWQMYFTDRQPFESENSIQKDTITHPDTTTLVK